MVKLRLQMRFAGVEKAASGSILLKWSRLSPIYSIRKRTLEGISYIPEDRQSCGLVHGFYPGGKSGTEKTTSEKPFSHKGVLDKAEIFPSTEMN